jgi:hypothetical protein
MRKLVLILLATIAISACSTTEDAHQALQSKWVGRTADDFVSAYGLPQGQYQMQNGDHLLAWGTQTSVHMPSQTTVNGFVAPSGQFIGTAHTTGGNDIGVSCDLQMTVSPQGRIKSFRIMRDTIGLWETSRCAEIFD